MKKRIRDIVIAVVVLAIICVVFWNIEWISSWKEIALLYGLLALIDLEKCNPHFCPSWSEVGI